MATSKSSPPVAQTPLILRCHRLMEAFAKADDEREFYLDRVEGFIIYVDLDKAGEELEKLYKELEGHHERYVLIPKLTFFETKKIMECFINEKVYDVDTKEKLLDIIQSKEARENFLEFIYDHHTELEKWQQYYQERSRIRIIEWLRNNNFHFVFEEDLDIAKKTLEKLKETLFQTRVSNEVAVARKMLSSKAKTYYSSEALNPRPKRGRPPKQQSKQDIEPQVTIDLYTQVPSSVRTFLFTPEITSAAAVTFSAKFDGEDELLGHRRNQALSGADAALESLNEKLASLRSLSASWLENEKKDGASKEEEESTDEEAPAATRPAKKQPAAKKKTTTAKKSSTKKKSTQPDSHSKMTRVRPLPGASSTKSKTSPKKSSSTKKSTTKSSSKTRLRPLKRTK